MINIEAIAHSQLASTEQGILLGELAKLVARQGCRFLEVGSWCGDSSVILGRIAKDNNGVLYCVDWWKGNIGTSLTDIASRENIYEVFWSRIQKEGLEDVVIPIRGRSEDILPIIKEKTMDLIYIDGDHRYFGARNDITSAQRLVKPGGILCGDDCEGRITDYEADFLEAGLERDMHEGVHCGVVKAVGELIEDYDISWNLWSAIRTSDESLTLSASEAVTWKRTSVAIPHLDWRRQVNPPLICSYNEHNLVRRDKLIYAIPWVLGPFDLAGAEEGTIASLLSARSIDALEAALDKVVHTQVYDDMLERVVRDSYKNGVSLQQQHRQPRLISTIDAYNVVQFGRVFVGVPHAMGPVDLTEQSVETLAIRGTSREEVESQIRALVAESAPRRRSLMKYLFG